MSALGIDRLEQAIGLAGSTIQLGGPTRGVLAPCGFDNICRMRSELQSLNDTHRVVRLTKKEGK